MSRFFVCTFGCRSNQADSAAVRAELCRAAMSEAASFQDADLIVINSCTVTQRSDQQVRQAVRKLRRENPSARIVVTGCYAERDPQALAAIPGVDQVIGTADKARLAAIVRESSPEYRSRIIRSPLDDLRVLNLTAGAETGGKTRPLVKLQDGCDAHCSYCIVPSVRGPGRSAAADEIWGEVRRLVGLGYQEIVLTGVNLGAYGHDLAERTSLSGLLRRIFEIPRLGRIRLSSIEPMHFDRDIVGLAAGNGAFARHFHIPLQSGSDRVLRRMRRPYTAARFLDLLQFIAGQLPGTGLGTDVMVGFPGETEENFQATVNLVEKSPLSYLHVFPFSARPGTDAARMTDTVPAPVIHERVSTLRALSQAKNLAFRRRLAGESLPAITLAKEEQMGSSVVLTDNFIHAQVAGLRVPPNQLVTVRILEVLATGTTAGLESGA